MHGASFKNWECGEAQSSLFTNCLMVRQTATVEEKSAGLRLDLFITQHFLHGVELGGLSRAAVQRLIAAGKVTVNGERAKPSARLKTDDRIEIRSISVRDTGLVPEALPLIVLYEDEDCVVINKAPGMVVHPAGGHSSGTLVNALLHHCPGLHGVGGELRPGIVHRLDKDTSGVMIVAKNDPSLLRLARQFQDRTVEKKYLALVRGRLMAPYGVIDRPIGRHRADRKKMSSTRALTKKREAITEWRTERSFRISADAKHALWVSLLSLKPKTGRTHQIRVHLADMGCPLVGDSVYGRRRPRDCIRTAERGWLDVFPRQALHAQSLKISHPRSGVPMEFKAPLWTDMAQLLDLLALQSDG
jgi:23S rRNA pseudouridine1911/1915/1917 synthase